MTGDKIIRGEEQYLKGKKSPKKRKGTKKKWEDREKNKKNTSTPWG